MQENLKTNFKFAGIIFLNIVIVLAEIYYGVISNSITLIVDALHNFSDIISIIISFVAVIFSKKTPAISRTFGYIRAEMMATFVNALILIGVMIYVLLEAIDSLILNHTEVNGTIMIFVATIALIANGISAYLLLTLRRNKEDINIQSAYLHFLADSLLSLGVVLGGIAIYLFDIYLIDKVLGIFFALYIIYSTFPLLKQSFLSLMDIEHKIDIQELEKKILEIDGVRSLHDIHIIEPSPQHSFFYGHLVLKDELSINEIDILIEKIEAKLKQFNINHSVIQPESPKNIDQPLIKEKY